MHYEHQLENIKANLSQVSAVDLGTHVTTQLLKRNSTISEEIDQVIFGNVLQVEMAKIPHDK